MSQSRAIEIRQFKESMRKKLQPQISDLIISKKRKRSNDLKNCENQTTQKAQQCLEVASECSTRHSGSEDSDLDCEFSEKYQMLQKLGEGGHSTVYKCRSKQNDRLYAVKIMRHLDEESIINFKSQFSTNINLINSSIIEFKQFIIDYLSMKSFTIQEYCPFKNLQEELFSRPEKKFSQFEVLSLIQILLQTLDYIHSNGVCHRDVKPQNILYNPQNGQIKLIDFDCSKGKRETDELFQMWTKTGTVYYEAPEYFINTTYTQKVDTWAVGIISYKLLTGKLPFRGCYIKKTIELIVEQQIDFSLLEISESFKILLKGLTEKQPNLRFDCKLALKKLNDLKLQNDFRTGNGNFSMQNYKISNLNQI